MGLIKVMMGAFVMLSILITTLMITRWGFDKFLNLVFGKESK